MVGHIEAADHIHRIEDLFRDLEGLAAIPGDVFDIIFHGLSSLIDHLEHGFPLKSMQKIEKCQPCKSGKAPKVQCNDSTAARVHTLSIVTQPEIFIIESTQHSVNGGFRARLKEHGISFSAANSFDDAYCLGRDLLKYKVFLIDARGLDTSFVLFIKVLASTHPGACVLVVGTDAHAHHLEYGVNNICYSWIGAESKNLNGNVMQAVELMLAKKAKNGASAGSIESAGVSANKGCA